MLATFLLATFLLFNSPSQAEAQTPARTQAGSQSQALVETATGETLFKTAPAARSWSFPDLRGDEWFLGAVRTLSAEGVIQGRPDGTFGPHDPITRSEIAVLLARSLGLPQTPAHAYLDVQATDHYSGAVEALRQRGLIHGVGSPLVFAPDQPVTRQQAVSLVMRAYEYALRLKESAPMSPGTSPQVDIDLDLTKNQTKAWLVGFHDRALIAPAHRLSVANANRLGLLDLSIEGWFVPEATITRSELAVLLYRAFFQPVLPKSTLPRSVAEIEEYTPLAPGAKGPLVAFLKSRLTQLSYPCGTIDETYDQQTKDAVMAFQKVEKMNRNGRVSADVWERLLTAQPPEPRFTAPGTRVEVDLNRQVLSMITDDRVWKVVHVSTGKNGTRTGHFTIGTKYKGWVKCVTLTGEMYYPSYVVSKTAIHGYRSVPPYPASHGCVRVPVWMAEELYYELPSGTVVDIFY